MQKKSRVRRGVSTNLDAEGAESASQRGVMGEAPKDLTGAHWNVTSDSAGSRGGVLVIFSRVLTV